MKTVSNLSAAGSTLFVGSNLDDAGLDVFQFRILGHLHRRAGSDGRAWPSVATIAEVCKIGERVVRRSLRSLVELGYVTAEPRPGRTTLYRPAACQKPQKPAETLAKVGDPPLADKQDPPLANRQPEGIPRERIPTPTPEAPAATRKPLERQKPVVVGGGAERMKTVQKVRKEPLDATQREAAQALAESGIVGSKAESLAQSGLTAKEIRQTCRRVSESGGRAGAMVLHLEAAAGRKAEGLRVNIGYQFQPAAPLPEWTDNMTEAEKAEVIAACRKFRQAS